MPERTFEFGNPEGRGGSCSFGIPGERWVKECAFCCGGVDFFWNKPMQTYSVPVDSFKRGVMNVDHLRGHQDHLLMFVVFRLILMSSIRSGSILCRVIDPRPISYLHHWMYMYLCLHRFFPPVTVYFSVGERRRPETDLHLICRLPEHASF